MRERNIEPRCPRIHVMRTAENALPLQACGFVKRAKSLSKIVYERRFRARFGVTPKVATIVWNRIECTVLRRCSQMHLLWGLLFLKTYGSEHVNCSITKGDEKTFRKWFWIIVERIATLHIVSFVYLLLFYVILSPRQAGEAV